MEDMKLLTKLLPDQVSKFWDVIKFAIEESLPPTVGENPDKMNRILSALLDGRAQCWVSHEDYVEGRRFEGVVVTQIITDGLSGTKNLLIYCLYGYDIVSNDSWKSGLKALAKWAISKKCSRIIGYTDVPKILKVVETLGGEAKYTFISLPLK